MSKKVKSLIEKEISSRLGDIEAIAVVNPRGINAVANNQMRRRLREKKLRMTVVKNTLVTRAIGDGKLKGFEKLLSGPSAVVYGKGVGISAIARAILEEKKAIEALELRGAFFDGEIYEGEKGVQTASKLPTREEAIGLIAAAVASVGRKLAAAVASPAIRIAGSVKAIEERVKEKAGAAEAPAAQQ